MRLLRKFEMKTKKVKNRKLGSWNIKGWKEANKHGEWKLKENIVKRSQRKRRKRKNKQTKNNNLYSHRINVSGIPNTVSTDRRWGSPKWLEGLWVGRGARTRAAGMEDEGCHTTGEMGLGMAQATRNAVAYRMIVIVARFGMVSCDRRQQRSWQCRIHHYLR